MQNLNTKEMTERGVIVLNVSEMPQENISVEKGKNYLLVGDNSVWLKKIPDNSIDSIVTDPPAGISFMSRSWDSDKGGRDNWIKWMSEVATECKRVLKPGGHAFVWAIPRTSHWTATAWENAGFEIRDVVAHVFGSGFPKSLNIGKKVDELQGNKREVVGEENKAKPTFHNQNVGGEITEIDNIQITKGTSEWEGWGTALKPAREDWILMRKPLEKGLSIAENCLKYGTGGINIDESRVGTEERFNAPAKAGKDTFNCSPGSGVEYTGTTAIGRFPANLILEDCEEVRECFPETKSTAGVRRNKYNAINAYSGDNPKDIMVNHNDSGNASRFFKSIMTDSLCSICCLPYDVRRDTMSVCNNTNVSSAEKSLQTTQATTESTALKSATGQVNKNLVQNVKFAGNLCDLCGTSIAQRLVAIMQDPSQESTLGELSMPEHKKQILEKCLVSFVELRGNTDTIPTMENLSLLFGYVSNAIEEYTQKCEDTRNEEKSQWKSLVYRSKASKSERNKGCEGLEEKVSGHRGNFRCLLCGYQKASGSPCVCPNPEWEEIPLKPQSNNHPTVKPIALMEYLIKMITPKCGVVLDPFAGSGSTLVAAKQNGYKYIGIEREEEYIKITEARLNSI